MISTSRTYWLWSGGVILGLLLVISGVNADDKKKQLQELRNQMQELQTDLSSKQKKRKSVREQLKDTELLIGRQNRELKRIDKQLASQRRSIRAAKIQKGLNKNALIDQRETMQQQIRAAYAIGRQDRLRLLLNQQDPAVAGRLMIYHDYFNRSRVETLDQIKNTLVNLDQAEREMSAEERRLSKIQDKKKQKQRSLEKSRSNRKTLVAKLNSQISSGSARLKEMKEDEKRLQELLVKIQKQAKKQGAYKSRKRPFRTRKGQLGWPAKGKLRASFGSKKRGGLKWDGLLIGASQGADVRAVYHGKVVFADWLRGFGLMLIVDHGNGYMTLYGHNQSLGKELGDLVSPGEPVAVVGDSGGQTEPGVYFAMRHKGRPVNPVKWLK